MIHWIKIDTDPDTNLTLFVTNMQTGPMKGSRLLSITRQQFTAGTWGYLIVYEAPQS